METINLGKVAFAYKGDYNPATTYASKDVVFDGESSYISKSDGNVGNALSDATFWGYLAKGNAALSEQNAEEIDTLRADLNNLDNEVSVKNAEQDNSIKSIEQILSQSNLNQTAQVSSTGREIVSLPKTASNGGMEVKLEGLTATNLVSGKAVAAGASVTFQTILNNKYYISTASVIAIGDGNIYTVTNNTASAVDIISVNLTSTFGSGNEPDFATAKLIFSTYFEGTKSFIPTGRIRVADKLGNNVSRLYLTSTELKSNGLVKDEVRKGANGYELIKRVGVGTLGAEKVLNGGFNSTDNWTVPADRANITNGTLNIDVTAWGTDVMQYMSFTAGKWYFVKFDVTNVVRGGILNIYGVDTAIPISVGSVKEYTFVMKASTTANNTLKINSANIAISIDNVSVKEITTSDGDLTGTTAVIYDTNVNYTLATPIITPINHAGILNSTESGTVYHEPVVADAAIYGTNISIINTTYPISSIEEIIVHTNVDTYLDVSKAVVSGDGLSFTHPDLRAGDLVLFTYVFNNEKVNGLVTATYYDGRYVIADTANGKFYKWGVKSTNGVATIQLTEV
ncbi:MAG: hypothetical protein AB7G87_11475 [Clostridia bacterium]